MNNSERDKLENEIWDKVGWIITNSENMEFSGRNILRFDASYTEIMDIHVTVRPDAFFGLKWCAERKEFPENITRIDVTSIKFIYNQKELDLLEMNVKTPDEINEKLMNRITTYNNHFLSKNNEQISSFHKFITTKF